MSGHQETPESARILIRCDAAPAIGFGHAIRCLALAEVLRDLHGCEVSFAMLEGPEGYKEVSGRGYVVHQMAEVLRGQNEDEWLKELIDNERPQALILDIRTDLASSTVKAIREAGVDVVTIDDPSDRRLETDLAFYPPVPQVNRLKWKGFTGQLFVGWDWVPLRPQFAENRRERSAQAVSRTAVTKASDQRLTILVTMGGSDPAGLTLKALDAINRLRTDLKIAIAIGSAFMHADALAAKLAAIRQEAKIYHSVDNMASLMRSVDLAVASFGVTAYELAAIGVPAIYLCFSDDHNESAMLFEESRIGVNLGHHSVTTTSELSDAIGKMVEDTEARRLSGRRGRELVDGLGIYRIAELIARKK